MPPHQHCDNTFRQVAATSTWAVPTLAAPHRDEYRRHGLRCVHHCTSHQGTTANQSAASTPTTTLARRRRTSQWQSCSHAPAGHTHAQHRTRRLVNPRRHASPTSTALMRVSATGGWRTAPASEPPPALSFDEPAAVAATPSPVTAASRVHGINIHSTMHRTAHQLGRDLRW